MRPVSCIALALFLAAPLSLPACAAEPDAPSALIGRSEAVRVAVQERLSAKFTSASEARKSEQGALVEYYSLPDNHLLWVDENGLTDRAKSVMEEIGKADEYGLRPADYELPKAGGFNAADSNAANWLADAEIKISFAVLGYTRDARGGRIDPSRLTENLDPSLALPNPTEVIEFDRHPLRPGRLSAELPARSAAVRSLAPSPQGGEGRKRRHECGQDPGWAHAQARRRQ